MSNTTPNIEHHPWEPFISPQSELFFLGSFPPKIEKWSMDFYYPNKINDFWRIMGKIFHCNYNHFYNTDLGVFKKDAIKNFLKKHKIAVGDIGLEVSRLKDNASDKFLEIIKPLDLINLISTNPNCNIIVSTGQKASEIIAQITNTTIPKIGDYTIFKYSETRTIKIYRMPSTSRAYPLSIDKKVAQYKKLFNDCNIM